MQMKERVVLAPGLNGNEFLKNLAIHGINSLGMRICGSGELARMALIRSGKSVSGEITDTRGEISIVKDIVKGIDYYKKSSYEDILKITDAIRKIRCLTSSDVDEITEIRDKLAKGDFKNKNDALISVCEKYLLTLNEKGKTDTISMIRQAIREGEKIDSELIVLEEFCLNPLEESLARHLSGGYYTKKKIWELFENKRKPCNINSIKNCYGSSNEVATILGDIYNQKRLDQCTVAVTDTATYGQLLFDYSLRYDIPMTFGFGIAISNSYPAQLLSLYHSWATTGLFGEEAIVKMLTSDAFDHGMLREVLNPGEGFNKKDFYNILAGIRFTNNLAENETRFEEYEKAMDEWFAESKDNREYKKKKVYLQYIKKMAQELALPMHEFILKYSYIRKGNGSYKQQIVMTLDMSALKYICDILEAFDASEYDDLVSSVMRSNVCVQQSEAGKLHVTAIADAFSVIRDYLYVAGVSALKYPGSPKENFLLLDSDMKLFGEHGIFYNSNEIVLRKAALFGMLLNFASNLGADITVSFSGTNVSELKKENASSLIYDLKSQNGIFDKVLKEDNVGYFDPEISVSRLIGKEYISGKNITQRDKIVIKQNTNVPVDYTKMKFSPTQLDKFSSCPKAFMLKYVMGIPEPDDYDVFEVISALDSGLLSHLLMEKLGKGDKISKGEFRQLSESYFDRFIKTHMPLINESVYYSKNVFLKMMETAYDMNPGRDVLLNEEELEYVHESGITIHGYPDRIERLDDGTELIVDYKSGKSIKHNANDFKTCLQVILYAYLREKSGKNVSGCEYRYIRLGKSIQCRYDEDMKKNLYDFMTNFKACLDKGEFPFTDDKNNCTYCKYKNICGRNKNHIISEEL